jgi:hypothetical protein
MINNSAYHSQTDGQTERVNQILDDMLRACVLNFQDKWDKCLLLAEFSYNNSYQENLNMAPFKALYSHRHHRPLNWIEPGQRMIFGPDHVIEAEEIIHRIHSNLKAAKARQESYANKRRQPLEFEAGDHMYLRLLPT